MFGCKLLTVYAGLLTATCVLPRCILGASGFPKRSLEVAESKGYFWHITDIHVDQNYSRTGNPSDLCHESKEVKVTENGIYGNFLCDSPQKLLDLTIQAMQEIHPKPDFIIWTGDNMPHTRRPSPQWSVVLEQINNITVQLQKAFPDVLIYPSIGNHDTHPPNLIHPGYNNSIYEDYLQKGGWNKILPNEKAVSTFKEGGYYSHSWHSGSKMISLNTILWYETNTWVENETNPSQFKFLREELDSARVKKEKVYIIGHVSPGYYNRIREGNLSTPQYHLPYLKEYLQVVKDYSDVISGQFFGHIHNDMFQLYYCDTGRAYSSGLLAGSVTPWHSNTPKNVNVSVPVNPSIRLMQYSRAYLNLLNYEQYFLNLSKANSLAQQNSVQVPKYELLYKFTDAYGVSDLSTKSLVQVYEHLKSNKTIYKKFFKYLTAGKETVDCDDSCRTAQLCSIAATSENEYPACMQSSYVDGNRDEKNPHAVAYAVSFICIFVLIAVILVVLHRRKLLCFHRTQRSSSYSGF